MSGSPATRAGTSSAARKGSAPGSPAGAYSAGYRKTTSVAGRLAASTRPTNATWSPSRTRRTSSNRMRTLDVRDSG